MPFCDKQKHVQYAFFQLKMTNRCSKGISYYTLPQKKACTLYISVLSGQLNYNKGKTLYSISQTMAMKRGSLLSEKMANDDEVDVRDSFIFFFTFWGSS